MQLVIAEKPSVGVALAKALGVTDKKDGYIEGNGYIVSWCVGHLVSLANADMYDEKFKKWDIADLPIIPDEWQFIIAEDKNKQFGILRQLMDDSRVTEVVNACDAGREGELIFRLVYNKALCTKPIKRLWISSMEEKAIRDGFDNLRDGKDYENLYQSALCRAKADWIVGINATRLFSKLYNRTLNVGRVQTPTLAMLYERENSISNFQKEKYFNVHLKSVGLDAVHEKVKEQGEAENIRRDCDGKLKKSNIIGNIAYTDIPDKSYAKLGTEKALAVADILDKQGVKFSGRTDGDKTTLTISKADMPKYKEALASVNKALSAQKIEEKTSEQTEERSKLYTQSFDYAQENGEVKEFQASHKDNMSCLWDIKATAEIYAVEGRLDDFLKDLTEKYGTERPLYVLSRTIQQVDDMRFSPEAKQIADKFL